MMRFKQLSAICCLLLLPFLLKAEDGEKERKLAPISLCFRLMPMQTDYLSINSVLGVQLHPSAHWQTGLFLVRTRGVMLNNVWGKPNHSLNSKYSLGANVLRSFGEKRWKPYAEMSAYMLQLQVFETNVLVPTNKRYLSLNLMPGAGVQYWLSRFVCLDAGLAYGIRFSREQDVARVETIQSTERPEYKKVVTEKNSRGTSWLFKMGVSVKLARSN